MAAENIDVAEQTVALTDSDGLTTTKNFEDVINFFYLLVGNDVISNSLTCYLIQFNDQLWLIPAVTPGAFKLKDWLPKLDTQSKRQIAQIDNLPESWRKKLFFTASMNAKLKTLPTTEFIRIRDKLIYIEDQSMFDAH